MIIKVNEQFFIKWETVTQFFKNDNGVVIVELITRTKVELLDKDAESFWNEAMTATKYERLNAEIVASQIERIINPSKVQGVKVG